MATYISLVRFTQKGAEEFKKTGQRAEEFKAKAKKAGVKVKAVFWTLGQYDGVLLLEAADDDSVAAALLSLSSLGYVTTSTLRAFTFEEIEAIIAKAP